MPADSPTNETFVQTYHYDNRYLQEVLFGILSQIESDVLTDWLNAILSDPIKDRFHQHDNDVRHWLNEPFKIAVLGDINRGKSSLINALLGAELLPVDIAPETITINGPNFIAELDLEYLR